MLELFLDEPETNSCITDFEKQYPIPGTNQPWGVAWREITGPLIEALAATVAVSGFPGHDPEVRLVREDTASEGRLDGVVVILEGRSTPLCLASARYHASPDGARGPRFLHADGREQGRGEYTTTGLWRGIAADLNTSLQALNLALGYADISNR
ncbi:MULTISPECIES: hypothetical protein [Nocardia]|uniref:hypothetical protein n=1 Tax=Nocardia TaxID=1817 RepID=UPI000D68E112|nr:MULTISPECIES: hypothetical protein [Nocardia]